MKNRIFNPMRNLLLKFFFCIIPAFFVFDLSAQTLPDFSGVWIQDKEKSDDFYKNFNIVCNILQTAQSFAVKTTFSDNGGKEQLTRESTFNLDGKETVSKEGAKLSAKWSPDKKSLTTSDTKIYGGDVVGVTITYSISENGRVLTVKSSDIKQGVMAISQVFNKKQ